MKGSLAFVLFVVFLLLIVRTSDDANIPTGILLAETPTPKAITPVPLLGIAGQVTEKVGRVAQDVSEVGLCGGGFTMILVLVVGVFMVNFLRADEG